MCILPQFLKNAEQIEDIITIIMQSEYLMWCFLNFFFGQIYIEKSQSYRELLLLCLRSLKHEADCSKKKGLW